MEIVHVIKPPPPSPKYRLGDYDYESEHPANFAGVIVPAQVSAAHNTYITSFYLSTIECSSKSVYCLYIVIYICLSI